MESRELYEKFRGDLNRLLTAGENLLEDDKMFLHLISISNDPKGALELAKEMKENGNALFKMGSYDEALEKYGFAGLVLGCFEFGEKDRHAFFELACCVLLNVAADLSKKQEFGQVGAIYTLILDFNPRHVKTLFRRAMAAVELGEEVYAYYDLLSALEVEPTNKEVKRKFDQVSDSLNSRTHRKEVPTGLGIGLEASRRKPVKSSEDGIVNEDRQESMSVLKIKTKKEEEDGMKEDRMDECESVVTAEDHAKSKIKMIYGDRLGCEGISANIMNENMMHEGVSLGEMSSSPVKNSNQAESKYRVGNRKKVGSFLSISRKEYQMLANGKSLKYVDSILGSFVTIRTVAKAQKQICEDVGRQSKRSAPPIHIVTKKQEDTDTRDSTMSHEDLRMEDSPGISREEVADNIKMFEAKEKYQMNSAVCMQKNGQNPSHSRSKHNKALVNAARRRKNSRVKASSNVGKRANQRRSASMGRPNCFACRFTEGRKRKFVTMQYDMPPKKKILPVSCTVKSRTGFESSCLSSVSSYGSDIGLLNSHNITLALAEA